MEPPRVETGVLDVLLPSCLSPLLGIEESKVIRGIIGILLSLDDCPMTLVFGDRNRKYAKKGNGVWLEIADLWGDSDEPWAG